MKNLVVIAFQGLGLLTIAAGVGFVSFAAGLVTLGVGLVVFGLAIERSGA